MMRAKAWAGSVILLTRLLVEKECVCNAGPDAVIEVHLYDALALVVELPLAPVVSGTLRE
jgi:hypothetical protein